MKDLLDRILDNDSCKVMSTMMIVKLLKKHIYFEMLQLTSHAQETTSHLYSKWACDLTIPNMQKPL